MLLALSLLVAAAGVPPFAPAGALSPVQARVMQQLTTRAATASAAATPIVLAAFDDPELRHMLKLALPPGATTVDPSAPAAELLARFRAEVAVAEPVHSFRSSPFTTQMSLAEVRKTPSWLEKVGSTLIFCSCIPTEMHGPSCIFVANLTRFSLEAMNATGAPNLWQLALAAEAGGSATRGGGDRNADHSGFGGMNAAEEGLFGFPAFSATRDDPAWAAKV